MKIAITINTSWNIFNFRKGLVEALIQNGHSVFAVAPEDKYTLNLKELGCVYYPITMQNKGTNPFQDYRLYKDFKRIYKEISPDVILQYTIKPNIYGTLAAKSLHIPVINNVSGLGTIFINAKSISSIVGKMLYKIAFKYAHLVFFQNSDDLNLFLKLKLVRKQQTKVLPGSGVNLEKFKQTEIPYQPFVFLFVGRLLLDKGIVEFVQAAKEIKKSNPHVKFQVLGFHDDTKGNVSKIDLNNWINNDIIEYLGSTDDVYKYLKQATVVVLPSYREGTPKTLLEAASVGRPMIATNVPGCKEVVFENKNGYLCEAKNYKSLQKAFEKMLSLPFETLNMFGKNSRNLAEAKFDEKIIIDIYVKEIKKIGNNRT